jgi:hypothetical protein
MRGPRELVRLVLRRLRLQRLLALGGPSLLVGAASSALAVVVLRVAGQGGWIVSCAVGLFAAAATGWILSRAQRPVSERAAAIELDARLGLEGRIATALALEGRADPFAVLAVEDGVRTASDPALVARARRAFRPSMPPSLAWAPLACVGCALLAWLVPARAPRADDAAASAGAVQPAALQARVEEAEQRVSEAVQSIEQSEEAKERMADLLEELAQRPPGAPAGEEPGGEEEAKQRESEALQRAAALEQRLGRELDAPDLQASEEIRDALAALPQMPEAGRELLAAMKTGRLDAAMEELEKLAKDAAGKDPGKAAKAQAALEALAQALDKSAGESSKELAEALEKAGMDPSLAKDPAAAQKAIEQAQKSGAIKPETAEALRKQAQCQQQAAERKREMAKSMRECKSGSCASARRELSRQQGAQRMQKALQMAMQQCNGSRQMGWSMPWQRSGKSPGNASGKGTGGGKGGKDAGEGGAPKTDGRTEALPDGKLASQQESAGDGDPLDDTAARDFVRAEGLPAGTSSAQIQAVAAKVAVGLEEGSEEDPVPGRLKEAHKRYFEQWKRKLEGTEGQQPPKKP